jgi:hypothetical protein
MLPGTSGGAPLGGGSSRPFIFAAVLFLLFLSAQQDLANPDRALEVAGAHGASAAKQTRSAKEREHEAVSEKLMLDVSLENERLEELNRRLRLEILALRHAVKSSGGTLPPAGETLIGVSAAALGLDSAADASGLPAVPLAEEEGQARRLLSPRRQPARKQ